MRVSDRGARKPGVSLLGTANDPAQASAWQKLLIEAGIHAIVRGHRDSGTTERRPAFSGVDVYVPSTQLAQSRAVIAPVAVSSQLVMADERPFPWVWLFAAPACVLVLTAILVLVVVV